MTYIPTPYPTDINKEVWEGIFKGSAYGGLLLGAFWILGIIFGILIYIFSAICMVKIAKKTHTENSWMAWIPLLNVVLMIHLAKKPTWMFLLLLVPIVNVVTVVYIWMEIAKACGKPDWVGILVIVPVVNIIMPGYLAFSK